MAEKTILRRRFRAQKRLFRAPLVVLQVEEKVSFGQSVDVDGFGHGDIIPAGSYTHWRDAKVEDIMCIPASIPMRGFPMKGNEDG